MKKYFNYLYIAFIAGLLPACEGFLEAVPTDRVSINAFYQTQDQIELAINACYDNLSTQLDRLYGLGVDGIGMFGGELATVNNANTTTIIGRWINIDQFSLISTNQTVKVVWEECYFGIHRCNTLLEKIEGSEVPEAYKERVSAEAKFLRAFYYFHLVNTFGDIPFSTTPVLASEAALPRTAKSVVVDQIIQDLTEAAAVLPVRSEYQNIEVGRVTQGAAQAYLMKVLIYQQRWDEAVAAGRPMIESGEYGLLDSYRDVFRAENDNSTESVFEVQCISGAQNDEGNSHSDLETTFSPTFAKGYVSVNRNYMDSFGKQADGSDDPRKDWTAEFNFISNTFFTPVKYKDSTLTANPADSEINYKLMRYADALLLFAEALNESGQTGEALTYVNQVRQRPSVDMPPLEGLSQEQLRRAIYDERAWELGIEGHRYYDLVRWGIAKEVLAINNREFIEGVHEVMPIPQTELDRNPNMTQNTGY